MSKPFSYLRPRTVADAIAMKAESKRAGQFWAGGTDLVLLHERGKAAPEYCIDLTFLPELRGIERLANAWRIGSMATLEDISRAGKKHPEIAILHETAKWMDTWQTRTLATVGGNLCHASPSGDLAPAFLVLDAIAHIAGSAGQRTIPLSEFFLGVNRTALDADELLTAVEVPVPAGMRGASYQRIARTVVDIALVASAVSLTINGEGIVTQARVAMGAVAPIPIRSPQAESTLLGLDISKPDPATVAAACQSAAATAKPISDIRSSKEYRTEMCRVLTKRALFNSIAALDQKAVA